MAKRLSVSQDPLNEKGTRNSVNTPVEDYNCLSYALGLYAWARPYNEWEERVDEVGELLEIFDYDECANFLLEKDVERILNKLGNRIRIVNKDDILEEGENLIAFREFVGDNIDSWYDYHEDEWTEYDTDFHAIIKLGDTWYEKCGTQRPRKVNMKDQWHNDIGFYYNSETVYFAVKEREE